MTDRAVVLAAAVAFGAGLLVLYGWYRRRYTPGPERLDIDALGLELMAGCCAFVVFTTPSCRPCKAALRVVEQAAHRTSGPTEVTTVDAIDHHDLTFRYEVRTIPTVFLITASGHVVKRWRDVPDPSDVDDALAAI